MYSLVLEFGADPLPEVWDAQARCARRAGSAIWLRCGERHARCDDVEALNALGLRKGSDAVLETDDPGALPILRQMYESLVEQGMVDNDELHRACAGALAADEPTEEQVERAWLRFERTVRTEGKGDRRQGESSVQPASSRPHPPTEMAGRDEELRALLAAYGNESAESERELHGDGLRRDVLEELDAVLRLSADVGPRHSPVALPPDDYEPPSEYTRNSAYLDSFVD